MRKPNPTTRRNSTDAAPASAAPSAAAPASPAGTPSRKRPAQPRRRKSLAAFLMTIPPGDAFDDLDFARVQ